MRLVEQIHAFATAHLRPGAIAVDATAGNGHDCLFLAQRVGPQGRVYAFDIQPAAIDATRARLAAHGLLQRARLIHADHAELRQHIPREAHRRIDAILFNLGYLPGGDKGLITRSTSSLAAIEAALALRAPHGVIAIAGYRGHPGGDEECHAIARRLAELEHPPHIVETSGDGPIAWLIGPDYGPD